jgi:hypothetical protein
VGSRFHQKLSSFDYLHHLQAGNDLCDENRDASHKLQLKIQELHAKDPAKAAMKVEVWSFKGDGTMWVNTTSVIKYIYTGDTNRREGGLQRAVPDRG